jgi:hypothetical protein
MNSLINSALAHYVRNQSQIRNLEGLAISATGDRLNTVPPQLADPGALRRRYRTSICISTPQAPLVYVDQIQSLSGRLSNKCTMYCDCILPRSDTPECTLLTNRFVLSSLPSIFTPAPPFFPPSGKWTNGPSGRARNRPAAENLPEPQAPAARVIHRLRTTGGVFTTHSHTHHDG